jgi:hypothetical protein
MYTSGKIIHSYVVDEFVQPRNPFPEAMVGIRDLRSMMGLGETVAARISSPLPDLSQFLHGYSVCKRGKKRKRHLEEKHLWEQSGSGALAAISTAAIFSLP